MQHHRYHLVDLPSDKSSNDFISPAPAEDKYITEYKRRAFWEIRTLDNVINCLSGKSGQYYGHATSVQPVNDQLIHEILTMDPDRDQYPAVIP
ncbi:hypothetical protein H4R35_005942, partial [Dimargaris xerosporica]